MKEARDVTAILDEYPFLGSEDQVSQTIITDWLLASCSHASAVYVDVYCICIHACLCIVTYTSDTEGNVPYFKDWYQNGQVEEICSCYISSSRIGEIGSSRSEKEFTWCS